MHAAISRSFACCLAFGAVFNTAIAEDRVRSAIDRVLPLLESAAAGSADARECYTCHNQGLPVLALTEARKRGFAVEEEQLQRQIDHTYAHLNRNRERYAAGEGTGGKADTAGSALWALLAAERLPDETTTAVAEYLLLWQADDAHWSCTSDRPPLESSDFTTTYLALRGLAGFGTESQRERIAARTLAAREWLVSTPPQDHEDRVFRLWALKLAGADPSIIDAAAADVLRLQRADGGWNQLDDMDSDAYATATALVALHQTGMLPTSAESYQRGVDFLLAAQIDDGSWHVVSRSKPFQTYFESGFPHGHDQFISCAASSWAALALLAALPEAEPAEGDLQPVAAESRQFRFDVCETGGIRRRNDVITLRLDQPEIVAHTGGLRLLLGDAVVPIQVRRVELPDEPAEVVIDFIGHFAALGSAQYVLELVDEPTSGEPTEGLTLVETDDAYTIDSSGLVTWTIRKDLGGLLDFAWKETDYIADESPGLYFAVKGGGGHDVSDRPPTRVLVERSGPIAIGLRFDYEDWPPGMNSRVRLEFPRTKSWIHATWTIDGDISQLRSIGSALNLRLDGDETLVDLCAGDFVYATITEAQDALLDAGPREGATVPWSVWHGPAKSMEQIFVAPRDVPTPRVHGWAHVMDEKRCTALAVAEFGEVVDDTINIEGNGRLNCRRDFSGDRTEQNHTFEFWLHFVTMPVHIGARTSPRSMQEPLEIVWPAK